MSAPDPLVPAEVDLTDFGFMPLDIRRLLTSETWIEAADAPKVGHASLCLWCESWHQVPAASLPDNDKVLARLAMCDAKAWSRIKAKVLAGWVRCSDGLLYHPVVAEKALESWIEKLAARLSSGAGNAKRWKIAFDPAPIEAQQETARALLFALNPESRLRATRKRSGSNQESRQHADGIPSGSQGTGKGQGRENITPPVKHSFPEFQHPADPERLAALRSVCQQAERFQLDAKAELHLGQWAAEGVTEQHLAGAIAIARERKPNGEILYAAYVATILPDVRSGSAPSAAMPREQLIAEAKRLTAERERRELLRMGGANAAG